MNRLVSFKLCTLTNDELLQKIDALTDEMYQTGRIPDRQIPARPNDDYDLLVGELVTRFHNMLNSTQNLEGSDTTTAASSNSDGSIKIDLEGLEKDLWQLQYDTFGGLTVPEVMARLKTNLPKYIK